MSVGRFFGFSTLANNGILAVLAAVVVLLVLVWALSSPLWDIPEEPPQAGPAPLSRPTAQPAGVTSPPPRQFRNGGLSQSPGVSGRPPWEPAPRPPGTPLAGW